MQFDQLKRRQFITLLGDVAARTMGMQIQVLNAGSRQEIEAAFASFVRERPDALFAAVSSFFTGRRVQLALQAMLHRLPRYLPCVEAVGLMS